MHTILEIGKQAQYFRAIWSKGPFFSGTLVQLACYGVYLSIHQNSTQEPGWNFLVTLHLLCKQVQMCLYKITLKNCQIMVVFQKFEGKPLP